MEVGSFRGNCKNVASDVIGFWPISIKRVTDLQVKHLAFFVALLDGVESCE